MGAYNAQSGSEQFLSMTKLHLMDIEKTIKASRCNEQQIQIKNNELSLEIMQLKEERDALYKSIQCEEDKISPSKSKKSEKKDRRSQKDLGDANERMIVETALHVLKGAIVKVMNIPTARTTMSVHFSDKAYCGSITIGNCEEGKLYKIDDKIKK